MTNPTSNYAWQMPTPTDLVTDLPADFEVFGQAVDTSVWNVGYGQAGKNKLINADFRINQRAFTSITTTGIYAFDRWQTQVAGDGTVTFTPQTFTANELTITGYGQPTNYFRCVTTGQTTTASRASFQQNIENVTTLAGTTVTFSFYAKAATGTPSVALELRQNFGSGGSATVEYPLGKIQISTSWARYSLTTTLNNLSGKTVGTTSLLTAGIFLSAGSDLATRASSLGIQSNTFDIWGVQVEAGSKATPFQTASGGSPQAELAMCQRYYVRTTSSGNLGRFAIGMADSTTTTTLIYNAPVSMRIVPTSVDYSSLQIHEPGNNVFNFTTLTVSSISNTTQFSLLTTGSTLLTLYRTDFLIGTSSSAYLGFNAEL
jgi:hypothetical protein